MVCLLLVFLLATPLLADSLIGTIIDTSLDALTDDFGVKVDLGGMSVRVGAHSVLALKQTFKKYDFSVLPFETRQEVYEQATQPIGMPMLMNFGIGFGSGSKLQGDLGGQLFGQIVDWTATIVIAGGATLYLLDIVLPFIFTGSLNRNATELKDLSIKTMQVGVIFLAGERVIQGILPWPYAGRYNRTLRNGLGINKDGSDAFAISLSVLPDASMRVAATVNL